MLWIIFIMFMIISVALILFGISQKKWAFAFAGSILLMTIGISILGTGLEIPTGIVVMG